MIIQRLASVALNISYNRLFKPWKLSLWYPCRLSGSTFFWECIESLPESCLKVVKFHIDPYGIYTGLHMFTLYLHYNSLKIVSVGAIVGLGRKVDTPFEDDLPRFGADTHQESESISTSKQT